MYSLFFQSINTPLKTILATTIFLKNNSEILARIILPKYTAIIDDIPIKIPNFKTSPVTYP